MCSSGISRCPPRPAALGARREAEELPAPECADARSSEDSKGASHMRLARMRSVTKRAEQLCACTQPTCDKSSAAAHAGGDAIAVRENKYRPTSARISSRYSTLCREERRESKLAHKSTSSGRLAAPHSWSAAGQQPRRSVRGGSRAAMASSSPRLLKYTALGLMVLQNSAFVLLMRHSRTEQHSAATSYSVPVVVVLQELFKLVICVLALLISDHPPTLHLTELATTLVPAACFTLQNNILYVALSNLDPLVFQLVYQMKTLLTALLSVLMLRRRLSRRQWLSQAMIAPPVPPDPNPPPLTPHP